MVGQSDDSDPGDSDPDDSDPDDSDPDDSDPNAPRGQPPLRYLTPGTTWLGVAVAVL